MEYDQEAIDKQLQESSDVLETLTLESNDQVKSRGCRSHRALYPSCFYAPMQIANVRVAGETRKLLQIASDEKECGERQELLAAEARASWQRMETILAKWSLADRNNDALELNALLVEQKSTLHETRSPKMPKNQFLDNFNFDLLVKKLFFIYYLFIYSDCNFLVTHINAAENTKAEQLYR